MKKEKQNKKGEIRYKKSGPKIIRVNLSLLVGIIAVALILVSSFTGHKISTIGTRILANLAEEVTDGDDIWEIVNMSESEEDTGENESENTENDNNDSIENQDTQSTSEENGENVDEEDLTEENTTEESSNEEQIASVSESNDDEASAVSNEDSTYSSDEGVSAVASTLTTEYSSIYNVGASTININNINWNTPDYITTSGDLLYKYCSEDVTLIYWDTGCVYAGDTITGTYTLVYEEVGYDKYGRTVDMWIQCDARAENPTESDAIWDDEKVVKCAVEMRDDYIEINANNHYIDSGDECPSSENEAITEMKYLGEAQDVKVSFFLTGTETLCSGNYLFYVCDIDIVKEYEDYIEGVTLSSGFSSTVYLEEDTTVAQNGNRYYATENDENTEISSLTTLAEPEFEFEWTGMGAGTYMLQLFFPATIISNIYTSYDGGETFELSTDGGYIEVYNDTCSLTEFVQNKQKGPSVSMTTYWKNTYIYSQTAFKGYHKKKIVCDDTESTGLISYTFEEVTSDHTFDVYYVANSYSVYFDGNGATSGSTDDMEGLYYDITYTLNENGFVRLGYTFTGWNTKADGSGTTYEDEEEFKNLTSTNGGTVTLYAQWEENKVTISITKVAQGDEDETLKGVKFSLFELICDNAAHNHDTDEDLIDVTDYDADCWELIGTYTSGSDGKITLSGLAITGIYRLVETETIEGYVLPGGQWKIEFEYNDNLTGTTYTVNGVELQVTGMNNPPAISLIDDTLYLYNTESYDIPTTGLLGFDDFWKIGVPIILMGMIIYPIRKRKKVSKSKFGSTRESVNNARHIINNWDKRK